MPETAARSLSPVPLAYPLRGSFRAMNSPARRVPSHGSHVMGTTYAIDLVPVDARGRSAPWGWRAAFATEAPEAFAGFGADVLAPVTGTVVIVHDGEDDHRARRSLFTALPYLARQAERLREGPAGLAGNHVVIAMREDGPFVLVAHLRRGSIRVRPGDRVHGGQVIAACGNSGNSTQPHVHVQATDSRDWAHARGLPIAFAAAGAPAMPREGQLITVRDGQADDVGGKA
ncbi:MAG TPA: M23 family metallopeptidase [Microbacterium sp.]|jgi:murein DD-endopeptidase MepM/ murein hydrolase activator NlpD|nr:M23 family metallopeptidase [Microbacterium sp.]